MTAGIPFTVAGQTVVVTGGAGGIGAALARRFVADGAGSVILADVDATRVARAAAEIGAPAEGILLDVSDQSAIAALIDDIELAHGPIALWCGNAGIVGAEGIGSPADWELCWSVNVLPHVAVARALMPRMAQRGSGQVLITASAAGLLTSLDSAAYSATKHAAVALAEWLAIEYADTGVGVSCLCPQAVNTTMIAGNENIRSLGTVLEPDDVALGVSRSLAEGTFLILPHPEVADFERTRARDRNHWLEGMIRLRRRGRYSPSTTAQPIQHR
jgi:NAD(P)-dependent dehydrogenase (short-subunit alcohol dehydrogenase family)